MSEPLQAAFHNNPTLQPLDAQSDVALLQEALDRVFRAMPKSKSVVAGKTVFVATGSGTAAWVLRGGRLHALWSNGTGGTSPVVAGGLLYVAGAGGVSVYVPSAGPPPEN